jgi:hypothetical protein
MDEDQSDDQVVLHMQWLRLLAKQLFHGTRRLASMLYHKTPNLAAGFATFSAHVMKQPSGVVA